MEGIKQKIVDAGYEITNAAITTVSNKGKNMNGHEKQNVLKDLYDNGKDIVPIYMVYMNKTKSVALKVKVNDIYEDIGFLPANLFDEYKLKEVKSKTGFIVYYNGEYHVILDDVIAPSKKQYAIAKMEFNNGIISEMPTYDARAYESKAI